MGLDDIIHDKDLIRTTIDNLRPIINVQYKYEDWHDLDSMETGGHLYNAYSLAFAQVHAINIVMMTGSMPFAPTDEHREHCRKLTRITVLQVFMEEVDDEDIKGKIIDQMMPLIELGFHPQVVTD